MRKKITLENIFRFRGQIMLIEKMKGKDNCNCGLCNPPKRLRNETWYNAVIPSDHYDAIKIVVPMSKTKFKELQKTYMKSFEKKDANERWHKQEQALKGIQIINGRKVKYGDPENVRRKRKAFTGVQRLYPLHKSIYDEFANYIYKKFGKPQFGKRKANITGVNWGESIVQKRTTRKYGTWISGRTVGVEIYSRTLEFNIDNEHVLLKTAFKEKFRKINTKKFRKTPGKLV